MNIVVEEGIIHITFPMVDAVIVAGSLFLIVFFGVLAAIKVSRGMI
jgi:hypothetical protein